MSVALSTSLIFIWMPASASCACMTSASCTLIGRLFVVMVKLKPPALPPSASLALALARSRLMGGIDLSYAQLVGGVGQGGHIDNHQVLVGLHRGDVTRLHVVDDVDLAGLQALQLDRVVGNRPVAHAVEIGPAL